MIDFRSDTVTKPTPAMQQAMFNAKIGDDVYGEDESITQLETDVATLFGHEAGLFCPSGTMTNQIAIRTHTKPGDELICDGFAHIYQYEGGGIAANAGVQTNLIHTQRGIFGPHQVISRIKPDDVHFPRTSLVCIENTCNKGGGTCWDLEEIKAIRAVCDTHQLNLHLDGARVFNALAAKDYTALELGSQFDSISICFSKGLGAPVGSVLVGSHAFIAQARRWRKVMGGGMRQAGYLAAAARYALHNHVERLSEDQQRMQKLMDGLLELPYVERCNKPETNIGLVHFSSTDQLQAVLDHLKANDILASAMGPLTIRFVTHLHHTDEDVEHVISILKTIT